MNHLDDWLNKDHRERLRGLHQMLEAQHYYALATAPYPANHGAPHIDRVMKHAATLLEQIDLRVQLKIRTAEISECVFELGVAILIHDIAMGAVALLTDAGDAHERELHAGAERLDAYASIAPVEGFVWGKNLYHAKLIAWTHAKDPIWPAAKKLQWVDENLDGVGHHYVTVWARLLRLADILDLGPHRLVPLPDSIPWRADQLVHRNIHQYAEIALEPPIIEIRAAAPLPHRQITPNADVVRALQRLIQEIEEQVKGLRPWIPGLQLSDRLGLARFEHRQAQPLAKPMQ